MQIISFKKSFIVKNKTHTVKNLVFSDSNTYIYYLGETYEGGLHDKTLWNEICLKAIQIMILADLGLKSMKMLFYPTKAQNITN